MLSIIAAVSLLPVAPPPIGVPESNLTIAAVEGSDWKGHFTVRLRSEDRGNAELLLVGVMEGRDGHTFDAMLSFTLPIDRLETRKTEKYVLVSNSDDGRLYRVEPAGPGAAAWTDHADPDAGTIIFYDALLPSLRLSEAHTAALFDALLGAAPRQEGCSPTYSECRADAERICEHGIGVFEYDCDFGAKHASCKFHCREPAPGGDH